MNDDGGSSASKREQWRRVIEDWKASGMSMRGYCAREGVSFNGFRYWRARLAEPGRPLRPVKLGVRPVGTAAATIDVVVAGRFTVSVAEGVSPEHLGRVVRALEALR